MIGTSIELLILGVVAYFLLIHLVKIALAKEFFPSYDFEYLQEALRYKEKMITRLMEYGYMEMEINWYFDLRKKLQALKGEIDE